MILLPQLHVWYLHTISANSLGLGQACGWTCLHTDGLTWHFLGVGVWVSVCVYAYVYVCYMCVKLGWSLVTGLFIFPLVPIACNHPKSLGHLGPSTGNSSAPSANQWPHLSTSYPTSWGSLHIPRVCIPKTFLNTEALSVVSVRVIQHSSWAAVLIAGDRMSSQDQVKSEPHVVCMQILMGERTLHMELLSTRTQSLELSDIGPLNSSLTLRMTKPRKYLVHNLRTPIASIWFLA